MNKVDIQHKSNDYCPQTLFLYGTYDDEGKPDFGLFCWFSYCYLDGEFGVMAAIGGDKLTKDNIHARNVFSANLVTEEMLPMADYFGTADGRDQGKMNVKVDVGKGSVLNVPTINASPWTYELEVKQFVQLEESEVMICRVRNIQGADFLADEGLSYEEKMRRISPAHALPGKYFGWDGKYMGGWHEPSAKFEK